LRAREVMTLAAVVPEHATLREAARRLERGHADAVVVVREDGSVAGLLTERDIVLGALSAESGAASQAGAYASDAFVLARPEERLEAVVRRMLTQGVRRALVTSEALGGMGLISLRSTPPFARADSARARFAPELLEEPEPSLPEA
jgi:CBS domain-containing protein